MEITGLTGEIVTLRILKGMPGPGGAEVTYEVPRVVGMVVLDAIHYIQHNLDTDLACRWNCKAAKCGSCSAEVNGRPVLLCKTRVDELPQGPISVHPMKTFPWIKDLVTDVSRNFEVNKEIPPFTAEPDDGRPWRIQQVDIDRLYEHRRCIECFLCQDVCHILRAHNYADRFYGPRFFVRVASLEMHPKDVLDRRDLTRDRGGLGYCNITKCCTEVCPEHIHITDNAIIPLKERVADEHWDPMRFFVRQFREHLPGAIRARRAAQAAAEGRPDPSKPPKNRGPWDEAALTNVEITEIVKQQIRTNTRPWEK